MSIPPFFVPSPPAKSDSQEEAFADLAKMANRAVPERRIYSINVHDGEEWTATVGERLRGVRRLTTRVRGKKKEVTSALSDDAIVMAIFPGDPYKVVTTHRISTQYSKWENPFMAGEPKSVTYFSNNTQY